MGKNKIVIGLITLTITALVALGFLPDNPPDTIPIETVIEQGLKLVIVDIRTDEYVPDFQGGARPGVLIANAVRAGLGQASDFQEVWVTETEYREAITAYKLLLKPQKDAEKAEKKVKVDALIDKATKSWTQAELIELENLIIEGHRFNENPTQ